MVYDVMFGDQRCNIFIANKKCREKAFEVSGLQIAHLDIKTASKATTGHNQKTKIIFVQLINTMKALNKN